MKTEDRVGVTQTTQRRWTYASGTAPPTLNGWYSGPPVGRTGALLSFDAMYVNSYVIWHSAVLEHTEHNFFIDLPGTVKHEV